MRHAAAYKSDSEPSVQLVTSRGYGLGYRIFVPALLRRWKRPLPRSGGALIFWRVWVIGCSKRSATK
jgi:hypothetical protein